MGKIFEDMPSLFPDQAILNKRKKSEIFNDYEGFIEKFKAKKTTDDCYTPENVYQAVLNWLNQQINISDRPIVRPFFPGFDYRKHYYPDNCIVVDNPPFSIYAQIVRFYLSKGIDFFLFAPALTQFIRTTEPVTYISVMSDIVYHNGAVVKTSFTTNLFPDIKLWAASSLYESIKKAQQRVDKSKLKVIYPNEVVTSALVGKIISRGIEFKISNSEAYYVSNLDNMKKDGKALYGGGILAKQSSRKKVGRSKATGGRTKRDREITKRGAKSHLSDCFI